MRPELPTTQRSPVAGTVLVVVAGLVTMLLMTALVYVTRIRADSRENRVALQEAQARITGLSAMRFIQESARLGWEQPGMGLWSTVAGPVYRAIEGHGWTDIRDGSIGPRGPWPPEGASQPSWWQANWPAFPAPPPVWWQPDWPAYGEGALPTNDAAWRSSPLRWPAPGTAYRAALHRPALPPSATLPVVAPNPLYVSSEPTVSTAGTFQQDEPTTTFRNHARARLSTALDESRAHWHGMLDPQPAADIHAAFLVGDPTPVPGTTGATWFRIYRELPVDHDGQPSPGWTDPYYDTIPIPGHSVFVIAAGAGGSHGFRFWSEADPGFSRTIEPLTASESGLFPDERSFRHYQRDERILFWRVEWSGSSSGMSMHNYINGDEKTAILQRNAWHSGTITHNSIAVGDVGSPGAGRTTTGHLRWIQRLDRAPERW